MLILEYTIHSIFKKCRFHRGSELFFPDETGRKKLQRDFSHECLAASDDFDGIGASECRGQFKITLYIYISREDYVVILIQKLDGGAERSITRSQGVAVKIEDGHEDGSARVTSIVWSGFNDSFEWYDNA